MPYKDPDKQKAYHKKYNKEWYKRNREKKLAQNREWQRSNSERHAWLKARYYQENREELVARHSQWRIENRDQYLAQARTASRKRRGLMKSLDIEWVAIIENDPCSYCGKPFEAVDHIHPISREGNGEWMNLTAACKSCNSSKRDNRLLEWLRCR